MKKILTAIVLFLLAVSLPAVGADSEILIRHGEGYVCGEAFELTFPEPPATSGMVTSGSYIQAAAKNDEKMMQIRVQMRNLTTGIIEGLTNESFKLTGYVRDRSLTYTPELIINYDYFGSANYYSWNNLPPLRMADILLIFRVNPILINWELQVTLEPEAEANYQLEHVTYEPAEYRSCSGVFQFERARDLESGAITRYSRE